LCMIVNIFCPSGWEIFAGVCHWRKGEVHMNLLPPGTPKVYVFFLFCITWVASVRRLKSLPKSNITLLTMKNVTQDVIFAR
jgi:hypothetical protein